MVTFMVIETGIQPDARGSEYSSLWEDGLMSVFFDAGHIVSNSLAMRLEKIPQEEIPGEVQEDFLEAARGGSEYFILIYLDYSQPGMQKPQEALVKIFRIEEALGASRSLIYEQRFPAGTGSSLRDEYIKAQETARIVVAQLKE